MNMLLGTTIAVGAVLAIVGFLLRRGGRVIIVLPVVIATIGALWLFGAVAHYQRSTGRELRGLVGYHYSVPEWGFEYAPGGAQIERWSFHVPAIATFALLLGSASALSVKLARNVGAWQTVGLWVYHLGCAGAFFRLTE